MKYKIDEDECTMCGKCEDVCLPYAIHLETRRHIRPDHTYIDGWYEIDQGKCTGCGDCYQICDNNAIKEVEL